MNWILEGNFESGITIWRLKTPTDKYDDVSIHTFGPAVGYTLTLGSHQLPHFKTLEAAQNCAANVLAMSSTSKRKKNA